MLFFLFCLLLFCYRLFAFHLKAVFAILKWLDVTVIAFSRRNRISSWPTFFSCTTFYQLFFRMSWHRQNYFDTISSSCKLLRASQRNVWTHLFQSVLPAEVSTRKYFLGKTFWDIWKAIYFSNYCVWSIGGYRGTFFSNWPLRYGGDMIKMRKKSNLDWILSAGANMKHKYKDWKIPARKSDLDWVLTIRITQRWEIGRFAQKSFSCNIEDFAQLYTFRPMQFGFHAKNSQFFIAFSNWFKILPHFYCFW